MILVIGSLNVDLVTVTVKGLPKPGETLLGKSKGTYFGGKGANQAVACARLRGEKVAMVGALGDDDDGKRYLQALQREDVICTGIVTRGDTSGFASVTVAGDEGENTVIVVPGANALLLPGDIPEASVRTSRFVLCQNEVPMSVILKGFQLAKKFSKTTMWNPAPAPDRECSEILQFVDILCVNESEARAVSGCGEIDKAIEKLARQVNVVIVTLGKRGCILLQRGSEAVRIPAEPVDKVVDTTGAGDCFCGALAMFLAKGAPLAKAAEMANHVAAQSVKRPGAQASYPYPNELSPEIRAFLSKAKL